MVRKIMVEFPTLNIPQQIRLKGKWLSAAGFVPGERVQVELLQQGVLLVRCAGNVESERRVNEIEQAHLY